jgi:hypothetical protein
MTAYAQETRNHTRRPRADGAHVGITKGHRRYNGAPQPGNLA